MAQVVQLLSEMFLLVLLVPIMNEKSKFWLSVCELTVIYPCEERGNYHYIIDTGVYE